MESHLRGRIFMLTVIVCVAHAHAYSSFWAPLFDRRILNYRVDVPFKPDAGRAARGLYAEHYGYRGERLVADLGNGKGPGDLTQVQMYGDVNFYYT